MYLIELLEDFVAQHQLDIASSHARSGKLDRAIMRALDAEGWPTGERGTLAIPAGYYYVNIWDRSGQLRGHVGPILGAEAASRCEASWRSSGARARVSRIALGESLTNAHGGYG